MGVIEFLLALAQDMILAAIPAVGFAMVFNVPVRALRWLDRSWFPNDLNDQRAEY